MRSLQRIAALGGMLALATPAFAQVHVGIGISIGPPPPREEVIVARPYPEAVWIPGYYRWDGRHRDYVWVEGRWGRPPHPHDEWVPGRWEKRHDEWVYYRGRWKDHGPGEDRGPGRGHGHGKDKDHGKGRGPWKDRPGHDR